MLVDRLVYYALHYTAVPTIRDKISQSSILQLILWHQKRNGVAAEHLGSKLAKKEMTLAVSREVFIFRILLGFQSLL